MRTKIRTKESDHDQGHDLFDHDQTNSLLEKWVKTIGEGIHIQ